VMWDENDVSNSPNLVGMIVDTSYRVHGVKSAKPYNHHSLLKTLEAGFGLGCLNHACDSSCEWSRHRSQVWKGRGRQLQA
jgi:hypothetical protein